MALATDERTSERRPAAWITTLLIGFAVTMAATASDDMEIAKKLSNPIASLTSVPFQYNYDENIGVTDKGSRSVLNIQPVIPFSLNADWNVISRTILPLVDQQDIPPGTDESGVGDVFQSVFFSPSSPTAAGWIWGAGPALLLPTASDERLGAEQWAAGPTAVALKQQNGWTYGGLMNHVWSFAGDDDRNDVRATFMQPFLAYTTPTLTTMTLNSESTYDWEAEEWSVPVNLMATQLFRIGKQPMSLQLGARYWANAPEAGPDGWGWRLAYTLVFPK
tara:strand:- start:4900 stop:5730 length:831 start_codon:yes stop_codon:yes gene_type:complete